MPTGNLRKNPTQNPRGRPRKLDRDTFAQAIQGFRHPTAGHATASDLEIACAIAEKTGIHVSPDLVRLYRLRLGIAAYPRRGRPPGAQAKPKRSQPAPKKPPRRLTISDEALARWHAQEYAWDAATKRYTYTGPELRPRDLPNSLPSWGGGLGAPYLDWARPSWKGQDWDAIRRGGK